VRDYIREEAAYREALALGLDRDDMIVRRRLRQKLEFVSDDRERRSNAPVGGVESVLKCRHERRTAGSGTETTDRS
jgi:hypothetical protein